MFNFFFCDVSSPFTNVLASHDKNNKMIIKTNVPSLVLGSVCKISKMKTLVIRIAGKQGTIDGN